ncbi:hypothetical protein Bca52824_042601 [Brassica carinata]|uniref:Uncharacterized protein n=1 Tax=Brassica carinata TaxID=52824 RepID=A0A8X7RXS5_BRACI|nr:hypothetical protein Bca52824_042601 [Brassica carinata]
MPQLTGNLTRRSRQSLLYNQGQADQILGRRNSEVILAQVYHPSFFTGASSRKGQDILFELLVKGETAQGMIKAKDLV